jgi:hypothetical protein
LEPTIEKTLEWLKKRKLGALYAKDCSEARKRVLDLIDHQSTVGIGDSSTVRQTGVIESLQQRGISVINPFDNKKLIKDENDYFEIHFMPLLQATVCEYYLTGSNVVTEDGRLLNIDGAGNRIAGMFWGHPQVMIMVGRNKIVKNLDEGIYRLKNVIAPEHFRRRGISGPPCVISGRCHDCVGGNRLCAVTSMVEGKPIFTEITVILVDEDLGLGWDESWPKERISKIAENHQKHMWSFPWAVGKAIQKKSMWDKALRRVCSRDN